MAICLEQERGNYCPSPQPEPRLYNGAIKSVDSDHVYIEIRYNTKAYNPWVIDTCPIKNGVVNTHTGETILLNDIKIDHSWPEEWGEFLGAEDPRYFNHITGYTGIYRNGIDRKKPLIVKGSNRVVIEEEGKNTCPQTEDVACRFDFDLQSIYLIPLDEFDRSGIINDVKKFPKTRFGSKEPGWTSGAKGTGFYDLQLDKLGLRVYHGQMPQGDVKYRYSFGFGHLENGSWQLAENPFIDPDILDNITGDIERPEEKGKKIVGKDVVYAPGGKVFQKTLLVLATRHDATTYLLKAPLKSALEHWNDGKIEWTSALKLHLKQNLQELAA